MFECGVAATSGSVQSDSTQSKELGFSGEMVTNFRGDVYFGQLSALRCDRVRRGKAANVLDRLAPGESRHLRFNSRLCLSKRLRVLQFDDLPARRAERLG